METQHAPIAPSSLARTVQCPGWIQASAKLPPQAPTPHTLGGEAAHWVAFIYVLNGTMPKVGDKCPNGVTVDDEMIEGALMYAEALEGLNGVPETTIEIDRIHEQCWGTPDFWQYSPATKTLRVTDYKFGHDYVEVFENWQLMAYAVGLVDYLVKTQGALEFEIKIELLLVQPRCYHPDGPVRSWTTSAPKLRAMANIARAAAEDALGPNPKTKTGPECLHCPVRANCETANKAGSALIEWAGKVEVMPLNGHEVGLRLRLVQQARAMLKALETGLEEQAMSMLRAGKQVPFYKVGYSNPRETWNPGVIGQVKALQSLLPPLKGGAKLTEEAFALTPKQAIKAGVPADIVRKYSTTPNGAAKLVIDDTVKYAKIFQR
jgi:hypothetical protein